MLTVLLMLIVAGCGVAFYRWRWGVLAAIVIALLQDPLRKMVPGTPGWLTLASLPIWLSVVGSAWLSGEIDFRRFFSAFPRFAKWSLRFAVYLLIPAALSATYGRQSWQITLLGVVMIGSTFLALLAGWRFPVRAKDAYRLLRFYAIGTAVLMIGGPLDYFGWGHAFAAIGTEALGHVWVTHRIGEAVYMRAGFFRGPDVMGWHAAMLMMIAGLMAIRSRGRVRAAWIALAIWGFLNLWLCGRRKMIAMLPVFWGCLLYLFFRFRHQRRLFSAAGILLLVFGFGWYATTQVYPTEALDTFYLTTLDEFDDQLLNHGVHAVIETVRQAGFWGYGLGMSQQGVHHIQAETPRLWQESGPSKIVAEFGVPGAMLFFVLGFILFRTLLVVVQMNRSSASFTLSAGIFSLLIANLLSAVVSAQIFGDPFIALFVAFLTGLALSPSAAFVDGTEDWA